MALISYHNIPDAHTLTQGGTLISWSAQTLLMGTVQRQLLKAGWTHFVEYG